MTDTKRKYDPVKRREYYLRTRELKGRKKGRSQADVTRERNKAAEVHNQELYRGIKFRLKQMVLTKSGAEEAQKSLDDALVKMKKDRASGAMSEEEFKFEMKTMEIAQKALNDHRKENGLGSSNNDTASKPNKEKRPDPRGIKFK